MVDYSNEPVHPAVERLCILRKKMAEQSIDWVIIYTSDAHMSEYISETDKKREYFSGFTGSAGTLVVNADEAMLWTDSRYYVQAEAELARSGIVLMRDGEEGVESVSEYIGNHVWEGQQIGIDLKTISINEYENIIKVLPQYTEIVDAARMISACQIDKPKREFGSIEVIDDVLAGKSSQAKVEEVRRIIEKLYVKDEESSYTYIVSDLCSIMWLLNIRGNDINCVPVAYSYLSIDRNCVTLYCNKKALDTRTRDILNDRDIIVREYGNFYNELDSIASDYVVMDYAATNASIREKITGIAQIIECDNSILIPKHIKNNQEINGMRKAHLSDAAIMVKFIWKVKQLAKENRYTEYELGNILDEMRLGNSECDMLSFETICAYAENAAIVHYSAEENHCLVVKDRGFLLVDSGGHYEMGTTDITRTISLGALTDEEKKCYTAVLKANLSLMQMIFPKGIRGDNLDVVARKPIWDIGYDYGHGTGHGIGCRLSVHEDPVRISYRGKSALLEPGVIVSDEPGIYVKDSFGIRLENALVVTNKGHIQENELYGFDSLTLVPFDRDAINVDELTESEIEVLDNYHNSVAQLIGEFVDDDIREWLIKECAPIKG